MLPNSFYTVLHYEGDDAAVYSFLTFERACRKAERLAMTYGYSKVEDVNRIVYYSNAEGYVEVIRSTFED